MTEHQPTQVKNMQKKREGRWSDPEHQKFLMALDIYGANWKKMKHLFENRTLSQIRSHAQKYFQKAGKKERIKYQRMAKLIEAEQIRSLQEQQSSENRLKFFVPKIQTKLEQQSNLQIPCQQKDLNQVNQKVPQQQLTKQQHLQNSETITHYTTPIINSENKEYSTQRTIVNGQNHHGHLYNIFRSHPTILDYYGLNIHPNIAFFN